MSLAVLCPGQGAQHVGMGRDFYHAFGVARRIFDSADQELGFGLSKICFEGPEERLNATDVAQAAIFTTSVAIYETLLELGTVPEVPSFGAGLSLGEYTALHLAGVLTFRDGLQLVRTRGQLMQQAATAAPSTMLALVGADEPTAEAICKEAAEATKGGIIVPANFNSPGQIVLSGGVEASEAAVKIAEAKGVRAVPLKVAGAFHSPYMQTAAEQMERVLAETRMSPAKMPVLSNVTAQPHGEADSIRKLLVQQIVAPVRWYQCIETLQKAGVTKWLEVGPGKVLTGLMRKIDRRAAIENVSTTEGLLPGAAAEEWIIIMATEKRVAYVTGGSRGIGEAIVLALAAANHHVVAVARNQEKLDAVVRTATEKGWSVEAAAVDIADSAALTKSIEDTITKHGRLDVLVNNAGITRDGLFMRMEDKDFDEVLNTNLKSAFVACRAAARTMIRAKWGRIINISSVSGIIGNAGQANYAASKAGLIGMTKSIARELSGKQVTANCVAPGFITTDMTDVLPPQIKEKVLEIIPLRRFGVTQDIAAVVAFLAGDAAGYITGQVIAVDGGMTM